MKKSPFPGMDPFIEAYNWSSFHLNFIAYAMRNLAPQLPESYTLSAEIGITARDLVQGVEKYYRPDIGITETGIKPPYSGDGTVTIASPKAYVPLGNVKQRTLTIRTVGNNELVAAIEILYPVNKTGAGLTTYRKKRDELIRNQVNLVEIDLLRSGSSPFIAEDWPRGTYRFQAVEAAAGMVGYWSVNLDETLPTIGVPLLPNEQMLALNLQAVFDEVYQFGLYERSLIYDVAKLKPAATQEERAVIVGIIN